MTKQMPEDTVSKFMCWQSQCGFPNCLHLLYWPLCVETCTQVPLNTDLSQEPKCLLHHDSYKGHHWESCPCELGTTSNPPMGTLGEPAPGPQKGWILGKLDPWGLEECSARAWNQGRELMMKWKHLFAHSNPDLGKDFSDQTLCQVSW